MAREVSAGGVKEGLKRDRLVEGLCILDKECENHIEILGSE